MKSPCCVILRPDLPVYPVAWLGSAGAQVVEGAKADEGNPEELKREIHAEARRG